MSYFIVVSGSRDATLRVWDIQTGECKKALQGHFSAVRWYAFYKMYFILHVHYCTKVRDFVG